MKFFQRIPQVSPRTFERIPLMVGFFLSILTAIGGLSLIQSIQSHDREQLAFELFKKSVEIIDSLSEGHTLEVTLDNLKGFVVLGGRGEVLQSSGIWESPILVEVPNGFWRSGPLIVYHRQISGAGVAAGLRESPGAGRQMVMWYDPSSFEHELYKRNLVLYFGLILLSALMLFAGFMTRRLLVIQSKLASQERLALLGQAARTISHEIQNPLAALDLHRQIAQHKADPVVQTHLEVIQQESLRIKEIISNVRNLIHPDSATMERIDLIPWLEHFIRGFTYTTLYFTENGPIHREESLVQIATLEHPDALYPIVSISQQHLHTIVHNLLINGLQSQSEINHIQPLVIRVSSLQGSKFFSLRNKDSKRPQITLDVIDHGAGLTIGHGTDRLDRKEQLFDPFFTTKIKGTGLGLALSRNLARQVGGDLTLLFPKEGGCIARLTLPIINSV